MNQIKTFCTTQIGFSHLHSKKRCQDHSSSYSAPERDIITACDGHGGDIYVRSHRGSRFASIAVTRVLLSLTPSDLRCDDILDHIRLNTLCNWNELVNRDIARFKLRKYETDELDEQQLKLLKETPVKAYGSTLSGAAVIGGKIVCVSIGDGGVFAFKNGELFEVFDNSDEPMGNVTHSLCSEDSFEHIRAKILDLNSVDGVLLCTDGVLNPYRTLENFNNAFVKPTVRHLICKQDRQVSDFIELLGRKSGVGDDVSLAVMLKTTTRECYYK